MITIRMRDKIGDYGENKDIAKQIRQDVLFPALENSADVIIDFTGVEGVTQSFIHALLADPIRRYSDIVFDKITFRGCNDSVRVIIETVEEYMQESL